MSDASTPPLAALPDEDAVVAAFRDIFQRRYFANHGPLVRAFDRGLAEALGVRHAICVVNGTVALTVAVEALAARARGPAHRERRTEVIVSALASPAVPQAVRWGGAEPVLCDIDPEGLGLDPAAAERLVGPDTAGILASHRWGRVGEINALAGLAARHGLFLLFDSAEAVGGGVEGKPVGGFGDAEVFALRPDNLLQSLEGGVIATDDDDLAAALSTIRSFHADQTFAQVPLRMNAKMSEAQAAMGLLSLADLDRNRAAARARHDRYAAALAGVDGLSLLAARPHDSGQDVVVRLGADAAPALAYLGDAGVAARRPGPFAMQGSTDDLPIAADLVPRLLQLPSHAGLGDEDIANVAALLRRCLGG